MQAQQAASSTPVRTHMTSLIPHARHILVSESLLRACSTVFSCMAALVGGPITLCPTWQPCFDGGCAMIWVVVARCRCFTTRCPTACQARRVQATRGAVRAFSRAGTSARRKSLGGCVACGRPPLWIDSIRSAVRPHRHIRLAVESLGAKAVSGFVGTFVES